MANDSLFEEFERQQALTAQLNRIVFGDPPAHPVGLLLQMEQLGSQLEALRSDLQAVKRRRPNMVLWAAGYVLFLVSGLFAMVAFMSLPHVRVALDMPVAVAVGLALLFAVAALLLFMGGFGWLDRGP